MAASAPILYSTYLQVNTVRGYRYLDDCGKIVNKYEKDFPQKNWQLHGLVLSNPDAKLRSVNVTPDRVWIQFERPDTLTYAVDHASRIVSDVCEILGVDTFSRLGLRVQYLQATGELQRAIAQSQRAVFSTAVVAMVDQSEIADQRTFEAMLRVKHGDLLVDFRVSPVKRTGEEAGQTGFPALAMMVDADVHREGEFAESDFRRFLNSSQAWVRSSMPAAMGLFLSGV